MATSENIEAFIARWQDVTASELSTAQSFALGLCELLELPQPHPTPAQDHMFERPERLAASSSAKLVVGL